MVKKRPDAVHKRRAKRFQGKHVELHFRDGSCPTPTKIGHPTRIHAKRAKRQQRKQTGIRFVVYRCSCSCWHVGTHRLPTRAEARNAMLHKTRKLI